MMRISYGRMFLGGIVVNAALTSLLALIAFLGVLSEESAQPESELLGVIGFIVLMFFIGSPISGLLCMLILSLFGKEEKENPEKEEPKEKIVYVVRDEQKKNPEDNSRYMPR